MPDHDANMALAPIAGESFKKSPPAPADPAKETPILRRGDKGEEVRSLIERLSALGYYPGPVDDDFGPAADRAVRMMKRDWGLPETGVMDLASWSVLAAAESMAAH